MAFHISKTNLKKFFQKLYKLSVSVKLAVFILSLLALITAIGTFIESRFNQEIANKLLYQSVWMQGTLILLALNLSAVLIDRWPWKKHHLPFVLAHIGILTTLLGAFMTQRFGLDGSLRLIEGSSSSSVVLPSEEEITLYSSYDGLKFTRLFSKDVDFFLNRPSEQKPYTIPSSKEIFTVTDYIPFGLPRQDWKPSPRGEPAVRFYLEGRMGRFAEWIDLPQGKSTTTQNLGPAQITLTKDFTYLPSSQRELVFYTKGEKLFYSSLKKRKQSLQIGKPFPTGWMDFQIRVIEFFPKAQKFFVFSKRKEPSDKTLPAVQISYQGETVWIGRNSYTQFYKKDRVYALGYLNKRKELGFSIRLLDFRKTNYQGSQKAKTYESQVETPKGPILISMNEPLKLRGYTFYQSGFEEGDGKQPEASILSVNRDPGRPLKYGGGGAVIIGIILLFYRKKIRFFKKQLS